jgi:hypothetical protein
VRLYICCHKVPDNPVPDNFSPQRFCRVLETRRSRDLYLVPVRSGISFATGWANASGADWLVYRDRDSWSWQVHLLVHQAAHMLLTHRGIPVTGQMLAQMAFPGLDTTLSRFLATSDDMDCAVANGAEEHDAVTLAADLLHDSACHGQDTLPAASDEPAALRRAITMGATETLTQRLEQAGQLVELLAAEREAFELIAQTAAAYGVSDTGLGYTFRLAATAAGHSRDALASAPSMPDDRHDCRTEACTVRDETRVAGELADLARLLLRRLAQACAETLSHDDRRACEAAAAAAFETYDLLTQKHRGSRPDRY